MSSSTSGHQGHGIKIYPARMLHGTCFADHLGHEIRWWDSFSHLAGPRAGRSQIKNTNFEIQNALCKIRLSRLVLSQDSKKAIFMHDVFKYQKCTYKMGRHQYHGFLPVSKPKIKMLIWNLTRMFAIISFITYVPVFWIILKMFW